MKSRGTSYQVIGSCGHNLKGSSSPWEVLDGSGSLGTEPGNWEHERVIRSRCLGVKESESWAKPQPHVPTLRPLAPARPWATALGAGGSQV